MRVGASLALNSGGQGRWHPVTPPPCVPLAFIGSLLAGPACSDAEDATMLKWALIVLTIALVAAIFAFGGVATGAAGIAKLLFVLFLAVFVISLVMNLVRRA